MISRKSVKFFIESEIAQGFRKWCEDIIFPEEIFFQTLCRIDQDLYYKTGKIVQGKSILEFNFSTIGCQIICMFQIIVY